MRSLTVAEERWPIAGAFVIARGAKTEARVLVAEIADGPHRGRGESTPYPRYGESVEGCLAQIEQVRAAVEVGAGRAELQDLLAPGAARNALDCALWDLEAKTAGVRAWTLAGLPRLEPVQTCYTLSLGPAAEMAQAARAAAHRPMLKLKIGGADDLDRVEAVRAAAPRSALVVDANEALNLDTLRRLAPEFARLGVVLIEQPLPAGDDAALEGYASPVPLCADESLRTRSQLDACARRYGCVNIKLDKAGGLTEALALREAARAKGLEIMAGCMVATSLAMAPALLIAQQAAVVDLDGPLLLARDREPGLAITDSLISPPEARLWG
ncbi:N-acetyl-D-Glu racemase DgcA [Caulobacter sp. S45]|uniref:N-acetyl-D-Glu racemase DgcA n=1 Tax=Caulobacter sp. S45 TaxID=1641861 RepID=UPI001574F5D6|nr:N-acetyl-D-Glu racemase DgcA [Caulobacter sp. S45]